MITQLTAPEQSTLAAVADRIIPADEYPSASDCGAVMFIDRLLAVDLANRALELKAGLAALNRFAQEKLGSLFCELSVAQQDELLNLIDLGSDLAIRQFFNWLVELVLEGYYSDPANGGNEAAVSWKMVGYDPRIPGYDGGRNSSSRGNER